MFFVVERFPTWTIVWSAIPETARKLPGWCTKVSRTLLSTRVATPETVKFTPIGTEDSLSDSRHNLMLDYWRWFITARKRSLGQGIIFTSFCLSVHRGCLCTWGGGVCPERGSPCLGGSLSGGCLSRGSLSWRPPLPCYGGRMGGTYPTGMNSCLL